MKRLVKNISIPIQLWEQGDLTIHEKWVLLAIDMYSDENGASIGIQSLSTETGLPSKEIKAILKSLFEKKAIQVSVDSDGQKRMLPLLFKERYLKSNDRLELIEGAKPEPTINIDYEEVAQKWNEYCPMLPPIQRWTPARKSRLRSCLKQADISIDNLYKVFKIIGCTAFLSGQSDQFKATFDWVIQKSQNISKIYEGFYARSYQEKRDYDNIIKGGDVSQTQDDSFYR